MEEIREQQDETSIKQLNRLFGSIENFYYSVVQLGYYLPEVTESTVTSDYLVKVVKKVYWCPKISEIKPGGAKSIKKYTKIKVFEVLTKVLEDNQIDDIGLRISRLPSKEYMLNLIWVLDNNNSIFDLVPQDLEDSSMIDFPIHLFNNVNTQIFPPGQGALFKRTKEQQERYLKSKYEVKIQQKQNRVDMLSKEKEKVVQRKQALERKLNSMQ
ncbi:hypothetical protein ABPG72_016270 [Tetrahymena utriculariae]